MKTSYSDTILQGSNLISHIDNTPLGIVVWDTNSQVVQWSERAAAIFEWTREEAINKLVSELNLIHEEDLEQVMITITAIINGELNFNQSINRNYTKSGKVIYCEWYNSVLRDQQGKVTSIISLVQDVTERINNEIALQNSEQQRSLIYNSAIDPMWLIDIEGKDLYRFVDINKTFTLVTGLTPEQVIGKRMEEVLPPSAHEIVRTKYREAIETGNVIDYIEISVHPAGKRVGEIRVIPVKDNEGRVTKIVGIANDRTDRAKAEEDLNELNKRLRDFTAHLQQAIEEERAEIAREIHDELGQQLTAIKMDIAWVAQKGEIKDKAIAKRLTGAMELLDMMVNTVRRIAMDLRPSLLDDLGLQEAIIWFAEEFENRYGIACQVTINDADQKIDNSIAITLFRVFQESLTNIKRHSMATKVNGALLLEKNHFTLRITDNGQGFNVEQQSDKQTLGLRGMEERVRKLNGHFEVQSVPGAGTTIYATIPNTLSDQNK